MPFMTRIPSDLARLGLRVQVVPGWETRGSSAFAPACVIDHWTAGPRGTTGRPSLNVVTHGRPGLDGPLCNVYLARDGVCVVVAAGRANHAGAGGFRGLVGNSAAYGIEAESGGDGDWTREMLDAYPRLNAALLSGLGRDASWVCGHNEWAPTRKVDIRDIIGSVRAQTAAVLANPAPQEDDDMAFGDNERRLLQETKNTVDALLGVAERPIEVERRLNVRLDALTGIVQQLATRQGTPIDMAAVEAVVEKGVADAIAGIETTVTVKSDA